MAEPEKLCDVCHENEPTGTAASPLTAVTLAYCHRCLTEYREPYGFLVIAVMCNDADANLARWMQPYIQPTLDAAGKTRDDLVEDARESLEEYANFTG